MIFTGFGVRHRNRFSSQISISIMLFVLVLDLCHYTRRHKNAVKLKKGFKTKKTQWKKIIIFGKGDINETALAVVVLPQALDVWTDIFFYFHQFREPRFSKYTLDEGGF